MIRQLKYTFLILTLNILFINCSFAAITNLSSPLDTTTGNNTPTGIYFSNDGSKVFVLGSNGNGSDRDSIIEYSLSTAYDVSTASGTTQSLIVDGGMGSVLGFTSLHPFGLTFNGDGSKVYVADGNLDKIFEITLGSNFDLTSSATHTGTLNTDVSNGSDTPCGLTFNNDGSKLFLAGFADQEIVYWSLSTDYDIDTEGSANFFDLTPYKTASNFKPRDVDFNSDGTRMYVVDFNSDRIVIFKLDNAFDLSSGVTELGSIDTSSIDAQTFSSEFNSDGTKFYTIGYGNVIDDDVGDDIDEFSVSPAYALVPTLSSSSPADNATGISVNANIVLNFSENVDAESGNITIKKTSDNSTIETIDVTGAKVSGSGGTQITVNPSTTLDGETEYYILIDATAFDDAQGGSYIGISSTTALSFTTADVANPTLTSSTPANNATDIAINSNIVLNFSETVTVASGNITIKKSSDDSTVEQINISGGQVTGSNSTQLTVNPSSDLAEGTEFYIQIDTTAIVDTSSNAYAGINDTTTLSFTTSDNTNPTLSSSSPADNATDVAVDANIVLNFSENVDAESGNITIKKTSDDSTVETIDVSGGQVSGSGTSQITVNPSSDLDNEVEYYLLIDATAFDDALGNSYAGISSTTALSFTSVSSNSNPLEDKDVIGLLEAQTESVHRIFNQSSAPILNRLQWLKRYEDEKRLFSQNIKFQFSNKMLSSLSKAVQTSVNSNEDKKEISNGLFNDWYFWSEGSVSIGKIGDTSTSSAKDINSNNVTFGMDTKTNDNIIYGYAFGFNKDDIDVGNVGTSVDIDAYNLSLYSEFSAGNDGFLETVLGFNTLDIDNIRKSGSDTLKGSRDGRQIFGSFNYLSKLTGKELTIIPNLKIDFSRTTLSHYTESGTSALSYDIQTVETANVYTGLNFHNVLKRDNFILKPYGGFEMGIDISPSSNVNLTYVSDPATSYVKSIDQQETKNLNAKLGLDLTSSKGFSIMSLYQRNQSENSHSDTFYFSVGYIPRDNTEYALAFEDKTVSLTYFKSFDGLELKFNSNYDVMSIYPEYDVNLELSRKF